MAASLVIRSRAEAPHLKKAASAIEQAAWSNLGYLSYTRSHYEYYAELLDAYPEYPTLPRRRGDRLSGSGGEQRPLRLLRA